MRNLTHLALPLIISSEGYGTSLVLVVLLLFTLLALLSVSTTLFVIGLVVCVSLVRTISTDSSRTCNLNFIGYNCLYGASHSKSYSPHHIAIGNIVREIRSTHTFIPHFSHSELEAIVSAAVS